MVNLGGVIFWVLFALFFARLFVSAYNFGMNGLRNNVNIVSGAVIAFAGTCICYYAVSRNVFVYFWDYKGYWSSAIMTMELLFSRPLLAAARLGGTIFFSDYNTILPMLAALPLKIAGYTFTRYVLVVYACFAVPAFFVLVSIIRTAAGRKYTIAAMLAVLFFPPLVLALLNGYIDIACLIPASLALLLVKDYDASSLDRTQIKRDVYISSLLLCTLLFRRYFAFFITGYIAALSLLSAYCVIKSRSKIASLRNALANIAVIGLFALAVMAVFFGPMLWRILKDNYAGMYAGYDADIVHKARGIVRVFGYFWCGAYFVPAFRKNEALQLLLCCVCGMFSPDVLSGAGDGDTSHSNSCAACVHHVMHGDSPDFGKHQEQNSRQTRRKPVYSIDARGNCELLLPASESVHEAGILVVLPGA